MNSRLRKTHRMSCRNPIIFWGNPRCKPQPCQFSLRHQPECLTPKPQWSTKCTRTWATTAHGQDLRPQTSICGCSMMFQHFKLWFGGPPWVQVLAENGPMPLFIRGSETQWRFRTGQNDCTPLHWPSPCSLVHLCEFNILQILAISSVFERSNEILDKLDKIKKECKL